MQKKKKKKKKVTLCFLTEKTNKKLQYKKNVTIISNKLFKINTFLSNRSCKNVSI